MQRNNRLPDGGAERSQPLAPDASALGSGADERAVGANGCAMAGADNAA